MAGLRFTELQSRPLEFLDFTSLTLEEFQQLVPPFETAFHARMAAWRMDGKPRTTRRFTVYKNCPLPTPEDRLLFILVYLKTCALQMVWGGVRSDPPRAGHPTGADVRDENRLGLEDGQTGQGQWRAIRPVGV
jgi:hypothetical protein